MSEKLTEDFRLYIADVLNDKAADNGTGDFVMLDEDRLIYVEPEGQALWIITVNPAKAVVAS